MDIGFTNDTGTPDDGNDMPPMDDGTPLEPMPSFEPAIDPELFTDLENRTLEEAMQETVQRAYGTFEQYRDCPERKEIEVWWNAAHDAYFGFKTQNTRWNYVIREIYRQCRVAIAQRAKVLFEGDGLFHCEAQQEGFDEDAEGATRVLTDAIERWGSLRSLREATCECCEIYGMGYTSEIWRTFKQTRYKAESAHGNGSKSIWYRETEEVVVNAGFIESYPPWDIYSHPGIPDIRDSPYSFILKGCSAGDLKTKVREGHLDEEAVKKAILAGGKSITSQSPVRADADLDYLVGHDENSHEYLEVYTVDGKNYVILDGLHLCRAAKLPNGKVPLIGYPRDPHPEKHWGMPGPIVVLEDQKILNQFYSFWIQSLDAAIPRYLVDHSALEEYDSQIVEPGGRIPCDLQTGKPDPVRPLQTNQTAIIEFGNAADRIKENMMSANGATTEVSGEGSQQRTATGVTKLLNAATERFNDMVRVILPSLKDQYRAFYDLYARNSNQVWEMRVSGRQPFKRYTPKIFEPNVDVHIELGSAGGIEEARAIMEVLKLAVGNPLVNQGPIWDLLYKAMGWKNIKQFHAHGPDQQGDMMADCARLLNTGIIADARPEDNHPICVAILTMFLKAHAAEMPPDAVQRGMARLAVHQAYVDQMMQAQAAMMQQAMGPQAPGATETGKVANHQAQGMFGMGERGKGQMAPMPQNKAAA